MQHVRSVDADRMALKVIAQTLTLSEYTVKEHVTAILQKLGCTNRVELITRMQGVELVLPAGSSD